MSEAVRVETRDGVCTLTLARAKKKNALTQAMYRHLHEALTIAAASPEVAAIRLRGDGGNFTAGNDLDDFQMLAARDAALSEIPMIQFLHAVVDCSKPLLAEVSGNAVGIGTTLLLHCDFVIAATDAVFALPFVSLGLVPEFASTALLPALVGHQQAARLLLLGDRFDVREAERLGLITQVCDPNAVEAVSGAYCRRITTLPIGAVAATRELLRGGAYRARVHAVIDQEAKVFAQRLGSMEHQRAFRRDSGS